MTYTEFDAINTVFKWQIIASIIIVFFLVLYRFMQVLEYSNDSRILPPNVSPFQAACGCLFCWATTTLFLLGIDILLIPPGFVMLRAMADLYGHGCS